MKLKWPLLFLSCILIITLAISFKSNTPEKINGVSLVAPRNKVGKEVYEPINRIAANWVAVIPYSFTKRTDPKVQFQYNGQWWGESVTGTIQTITHANEMNLNVMLKPHTWVLGEGWAGDFDLNSEDEWKVWESSYRDYILTFAKVADSLNVPLFCIGTEYRKAVVKRPAFWKELIREVRDVYSGKLTYAANWDNYQNVSFWQDLDYIGVDAYFPLNDAKTPTIEQLESSWAPIINELESFSKKWNKQILFTEFGYKSTDYTADGHWKYDGKELGTNQLAQANAYESAFGLWKQNWFGGGFLWKWHTNHESVGGPDCKEFTPQNKKAEEVIRKFYSKN
ncbi:glycoside hydrolase family 113 [Fulvivirga lutea]|uniref:Glycoside hydrolase n=1 Tax=Fulvivirga lutea TaxID=2810512 RepID=A0A974WF80_9BACT|nr:hypothetical protein [Fulvivirga lutea]QSE96368.1 hypothetical protein JR347_12200 [Fulvivirga lutea]